MGARRRWIAGGFVLCAICSSLPVRAEDSPGFLSRHHRAAWVGALAVTATGAGVAWWARGRANEAYADYLGAVDPERVVGLIDETRRWDRRAVGALVVAEVGLLATLYVLFFSEPAPHLPLWGGNLTVAGDRLGIEVRF